VALDPALPIKLVDNGDGTYSLATSGAGGGGSGTEFAEDAAHSTGALGTLVLAVRTDTAAARATTDGDYIPLITDSEGKLHVNVGALPAEATAIIAWAPRSATTGNAYVPGFYNVCDTANTEEFVAIPTTPAKPMSLMIWFEASTSDETLKSGRIGFADNSSDDPGTVNNSDVVLGYHPAIPMEYVIPSWATHVWVAAPTSGRVARGLWTYE
jgi:hypothetical protein